LTFEMLCEADHPDYLADNGAFGFRLAREINSPAFKILYDIYHMHRMGEETCQAIIDNLDIIAHIHVAGSPLRDFPSPEGEINYGRILSEVHKAGYAGYWGLEFKPVSDPLQELTQIYGLLSLYV